MTLQNNDVLGTMFPIEISEIVQKSNATWGLQDTHRVEAQMAFTLYVYFGALHVDLHAPCDLTETAAQLLRKYGLPEFQRATSSLYDVCVRRGSFCGDIAADFDLYQQVSEIIAGDPHWVLYCETFLRWSCTNQMKAYTLRTLKRFTVDGALSLETECLRKFITTDNDNRKMDQVCDTHYTLLLKSIAKQYLQMALDGFDQEKVLNQVTELRFTTTSHGVRDCCKDPRHRVGYVLSTLGWLPGHLHRELGNDYVPFPGLAGSVVRDESCVDIGSVPKDVKSYRIVSPDNPANLAFQKAIFDEIMRVLDINGLSHNLPLLNQEVMRTLVYRTAAGEERYATLDLSSASDTLRLKLFREIFPKEVCLVVERCRPTKYVATRLGKKKPKTLYMLAPMGCAFTTLLQSLTFWAIDSAACHLQKLFNGEMSEELANVVSYAHEHQDDDNPSFLVDAQDASEIFYPCLCYAMGDDQQVPQIYAEACIEALQSLGFIVNVSKSFYDSQSLFRESCGAEAITGDDPVVDGFYFPRHALRVHCSTHTGVVRLLKDLSITSQQFWTARDSSGNALQENTVTALIAMTKSYQLLGLPRMATLINQWLVTCIPGMTVSRLGEPTSDLWGASEIVHHFKRYPTGQFNDKVTLEFSPEFFFKKVEVTHRVLTTNFDDSTQKLRPVHWSVTTRQKKLGNVYNPENGVHDVDSCAICRWLAKSEVNRYFFKVILTEYRYQHWLWMGPNYESDLDKLLGVTSPTPQLDVISDCVVGTKF